ncbi:MAG: heavy metal-binding domain-containing protein, partial [Ferruginibacter sp.]
MMTHTYNITGMTCNGCVAKAKSLLSAVAGVENVSIDLAKGEATLDMKKHVPTTELKSVLKDYKYKIEKKKVSHAMNQPAAKAENESTHTHVHKTSNNSDGKYYCPMHCEGDKMYDKPGDCPVCGMSLEKVPSAPSTSERAGGEVTKYTCPMHPEIIRDAPGSCPICGMDLVPMQPIAEEENKTYNELLKKFRIAVAFTIPILIIAMSDMIPDNPLLKMLSQEKWNWIQMVLSIPVVFYAGWMFFKRAWKSVITWNLNMFTLIGIGTGVAFLFSVIAMLFPGIFPNQFKTESGTVFVYFEAATVILALVLLGQLLEARAHSRTSGAIKELL